MSSGSDPVYQRERSRSQFRAVTMASRTLADVFDDVHVKERDDTSSVTVDIPHTDDKNLGTSTRSVCSKWGDHCRSLLHSTPFNFCIAVIVIFGAIGDDIRLMSETGSTIDAGFDAALFAVFCVLALELILKIYLNPFQILSPWTLLDSIGIVSILFRVLTRTQDLGGRFNNLTSDNTGSNVVLSVLFLLGQSCLVARIVRQLIVSKFIRKTVKAISVYTSLIMSTWSESRRKSKEAHSISVSERMKRGYSKSKTAGASRSLRGGQSRVMSSRSRIGFAGTGGEVKASLRKSVTALVTQNSGLSDDNDDDDDQSIPDNSQSSSPQHVGTRTRLNLEESLGISTMNPFTIGRTIMSNLSPSEISDQVGTESRLVRRMKEKSILLISMSVIIAAIVGFLCFPPSLALMDPDTDQVAVFTANSLATGFASGSAQVYALSVLSAVSAATTTEQGLVKIAWIGSFADKPTNVSLNDSSVLSDYLKTRLANSWSLSCSDIPPAKYVSIRYGGSDCPLDVIRPMDIGVVTSGDESFIVITDKSDLTKSNALFSLLFSAFVFVAVLVGSLIYFTVCETLVLIPFSRVTHAIERMRNDPSSATRMFERMMRMDLEYQVALAAYEEISWRRKLWAKRPVARDGRDLTDQNEPRELEKNVLKIGSLLMVGFGAQGTEVVVSNIRDTNEGLRVVSDSGNTVEAIFGYFGIQDFDIITEMLQSRMIVFVNQVAEIVHGLVDEYGGFTCRSTGDGFFAVWKIMKGGDEDESEKMRERICELAVIACIKIQIAITKSPVLAEYRNHPHLMNRLKNFRVSLGMSLHLGTGIEGAIGSEFRLEANYLGQHAVMAQRLAEVGTNIYKIPLILTGSLVGSVSRDFCNATVRRIDKVHIDGYETNLYSVDIDLFYVRVVEPVVSTGHPQERLADYNHKKSKMIRKKLKMDPDYAPVQVVIRDRELASVRTKFSSDTGELFRQMFDKGLVNYEAGEWELATNALKQTLVFWKIHTTREERALSPKSTMNLSSLVNGEVSLQSLLNSIDSNEPGGFDGPSFALLLYIDRMDADRKRHWNGVRAIS